MGQKELDKALSLLALFAIAVVIALMSGIIGTGMGQDFFQVVRLPSDYVDKFIGHSNSPFGLRLNLGFDNLFIVVYGTYFVLLAARLRGAMDPVVRGVALGAILLTVFLDMVENHHIITMLQSAQSNIPLSLADAELQMIASNVKFHSSYLALTLFAFGFRHEGGIGRIIAWVFWIYVLLGIIALATPLEMARPLALGRTFFFLVSFILSALFFRASAKRQK